jgi:uncharacterized protein YjiS (DUF1127 family)
MSASTCGHLIDCQVSQRSAPARPAAALATIRRAVTRWRSRLRERRVLDSFADRDLHDLGLSRWDIEREISRPLWRD